jgi:hypothetical protein
MTAGALGAGDTAVAGVDLTTSFAGATASAAAGFAISAFAVTGLGAAGALATGFGAEGLAGEGLAEEGFATDDLAAEGLLAMALAIFALGAGMRASEDGLISGAAATVLIGAAGFTGAGAAAGFTSTGLSSTGGRMGAAAAGCGFAETAAGAVIPAGLTTAGSTGGTGLDSALTGARLIGAFAVVLVGAGLTIVILLQRWNGAGQANRLAAHRMRAEGAVAAPAALT